MHWESHVKAFRIQWIYRYLDPRRAPWKQVLDHWIAAPHFLERAALIAPHKDSLANALPHSLRYLRRAIREFEDLGLTQILAPPNYSVQAEPLWQNPRFEIPIPDLSTRQWQQWLKTIIVTDLFDRDTGLPFTPADWDGFFYTMAPDKIRNTPSVHEWVNDRRSDLAIIVNAIPQAIIDAATTVQTAPHYIALVDDSGTIQNWVQPVTTDDGDTRYLELWLDISNSPHLTGRTLQIPFRGLNAVPATHWTTTSEDFWGQPEENRTRIQIAGPDPTAFPNNAGWTLTGHTTHNNQDPHKHTLYNTLTIQNITHHLTDQIVGDTRPNCEANWKTRIPYPLDWKGIWASLGTPLSDATEERTWRKLLHRAIYVRNRDPTLPSDKCRLRCGFVESQLHLARCTRITAFWSSLLAFIAKIVPNHTQPGNHERAIIFGQWGHKKMGSMMARAILRHGWMVLYRHFTQVETNGTTFYHERTYLHTLTSVRSAALRKAKELAIAHARNAWSASDPHSPTGYHAEMADTIAPLVTIDTEWKPTTSPSFEAEIKTAELALKAKMPN